MFDVPVPEKAEGVYFLRLSLTEGGKEVSRHIYWLTTREKDYITLTQLPACKPEAKLTLQKQNGIYKGMDGKIKRLYQKPVIQRLTRDPLLFDTAS